MHISLLVEEIAIMDFLKTASVCRIMDAVSGAIFGVASGEEGAELSFRWTSGQTFWYISGQTFVQTLGRLLGRTSWI